MSLYVIGNYTEDTRFSLARLPAEGETMLASSSSSDFGGKGANQAAMAARCGVPPAFVVALGDDTRGERARERLCAEGISPHHFFTARGPTDRSIILLAEDGGNAIVSTCEAARQLPAGFCENALSQAQAGDIVLLQGNLSFELTAHCLNYAKRRGAVTLFNPAPVADAFAALWPLCDIVIVNEPEARAYGGCSDAVEAGRGLLAHGTSTVIATLGARGAIILTAQRETATPSPRVKVRDTSGAGDAFCGVLAASLARGLPPEAAIRLAVKAASIAVTRYGTLDAYPSRREMEMIYAKSAHSASNC